MPYRNGNIPPNSITWTGEMKSFIRDNFSKMTNRELATAMNLGLTSVRTMCYSMGLKRMEMEYWTDEQVMFLQLNYKKMGDTELAEIFNSQWPKKKLWTIKHIEKKRGYLKLGRTEKEISEILQRNIDQGRLNLHSKGKTNWLTTGPAKQKEIRMYKNCNGVIYARIKIGRRWVNWGRWAWENKYGPVPNGKIVCMKDGDPYNTRINNLVLLTKSQSASRNVAMCSKNLSENYVAAQMCYGNPEMREAVKQDPELIKTYRDIMLFNRKIKTIKNAQHK